MPRYFLASLLLAAGASGYDFEPKYKVKIISNVRVPMRDGVELALKITRPDAEGKFPCIMEYNPYRRIKKPLADYHDEYPPVIPYLAERGYIVVQFDVRGTGNSGGISQDIYSDDERKDGYEMVEWIAAQPWSNGNVGMLGKSYSAVVQWQVAVQNPPHLKAIIVRSANDDVYTEWTNPGGAFRPYMFDLYGPLMTASNFAPPEIDIVGEKWSDIWKQRLEHNKPWSIGYIEHQTDGPYWRARSLRPGYDRVKCPVFVIDGWSDWYSTSLLRAFANLKVPKKVLIGPWGHYYAEEKLALPAPRIDTRREYLRWFDQWLKGIDTGIMNEPPVTLFVREYKEPAPFYLEDAGFWRNEKEWPPARAQYTPMYFQNYGTLSPKTYRFANDEPATYQYNPAVGIAAGLHGYGPWARPLDQRIDEAYSLNYTTAPLTSPMEVTGDPAAVLHVSSTAEGPYFHVTLSDVAPDGTSKKVTDGGLLGSHRSSHAKPEPMKPEEVYELKVELKYVAYRFAPGHRVRVSISSADFQNAWPAAKAAMNAVHRSDRYLSRIMLPVVQEQSPNLPLPNFAASPHPLPDPNTLLKPFHAVVQDLVNQTTSYTYQEQRPMEEGFSTSFTVSNKNPGEAVAKTVYTYTTPGPGFQVKVTAQSITTSDETTFRHLVDVEVSLDGKRHFNKSWSVQVPRMLN